MEPTEPDSRVHRLQLTCGGLWQAPSRASLASTMSSAWVRRRMRRPDPAATITSCLLRRTLAHPRCCTAHFCAAVQPRCAVVQGDRRDEPAIVALGGRCAAHPLGRRRGCHLSAHRCRASRRRATTRRSWRLARCALSPAGRSTAPCARACRPLRRPLRAQTGAGKTHSLEGGAGAEQASASASSCTDSPGSASATSTTSTTALS